ncbi:MAG: TRAP transporter substrate-binding protein [Planctomycetaceae bacterium]|nr:TRAP transporter substrate-binding protein [Planctomycetaceae bacterium]
MKKLMSLLAAFILCAGLAQAASYRLSEVHAEGYPTALADREFARLVEERTNGRIKIEVYTGGTLYGEETGAIEALQVGDLAFTRVSASPVASYVPNINAVQMPYLYKSGEHMWDALNGEIGQGLLADIETSGSGLVGLCYYDAGSRCFYTTKPVNKVADMRGLKIRMQNNAMMVRMVSLLGGTGVTGIGPNEVYSAIQTGTVDGAENNWPTYQNMGDYEVAKYYILDHHTRVPEILLMSKVVKDDMSAADFAIIQQCAKDTQAFEIKAWADKEKSSEEIVRAAGTQVITLTPEAFAEFQKAMEPLYDEFGKDFMETIQAIQKVGEKY